MVAPPHSLRRSRLDERDPAFLKLFLVLFALIVLLMVVMIVKAAIQTRRTKDYVATRGWTYRSRDRKLATRWTGPPFENGHDRRCEDIVEGTYDGVALRGVRLPLRHRHRRRREHVVHRDRRAAVRDVSA